MKIKRKGHIARVMIDTHIFIDYLTNQSNLNDYAIELMDDVNVEKVMSVESIKEMIYKFKKNKLRAQRWKTPADIIKAVTEECYITVINVTLEVMNQYAQLYINEWQDHNDPSDHIIVCQAIVEHIPLVAHDSKYGYYRDQGLDLIQAD